MGELTQATADLLRREGDGGYFIVMLASIVVIVLIVTIGCTVYYSLKLYS